MQRPFGIYVHIPYCSRKCPYCDFTTFAVPRVPQERYMASLARELKFYANHEDFRNRVVKTIFFGGGTPSLIDPKFIAQFISEVTEIFPESRLEEVTLEANPGAVTADRLSGYNRAGVTRLSFGAQSLNQKHLTMLGRTHTPSDIRSAIAGSREAGFQRVSIDLLFGVPQQTVEEVEVDLDEMIELGVDHLSAYGLTYEKGTPYYQSVARKVLQPLSDDVTADMYELIIDRLIEQGFEHYEISNFAKPGFRSLHNLSYWNGDDYLGVGVGAHSHLGTFENGMRTGGKRWANLAQPISYMDKTVATESVVSWTESLTDTQVKFEHLFLGLRRMSGVSFAKFRSEFGAELDAVFAAQLQPFLSGGLLIREGDTLFLSRRGTLLADSVLESFAG